jgi:hypothetical protein
VGRKRVAQRVATGALGDPGLPHGLGHRSLHGCLMQVEPGRLPPPRIPAHTAGREHELPAPVDSGVSMSFTRRSRHSLSRRPAPYNSIPASQGTPVSLARTARTSLRSSTTGRRMGCRARTIPSRSGRLIPRTSPYRNTSA